MLTCLGRTHGRRSSQTRGVMVDHHEQPQYCPAPLHRWRPLPSCCTGEHRCPSESPGTSPCRGLLPGCVPPRQTTLQSGAEFFRRMVRQREEYGECPGVERRELS